MKTAKKSTYVSKSLDAAGNVAYTADENAIWNELILRQMKHVPNRACDEYLHALEQVDFPLDRIPQCHEVSRVLQATTGWTLEPVPALIGFDRFFHLLANKKFPAATFIRRREELNYLQEPDIFHEIFGHAPLLTHPACADFTHMYGKLGLQATPEERVMLAKLYWFTIEFGLIQTQKGLRAYGGGILSSIGETEYALASDIPQRKPFEVLDVLRTPYRIDIMQPIYFVIESFDTLFQLTELDLIALIHEAKRLGLHKPLYQSRGR